MILINKYHALLSSMFSWKLYLKYFLWLFSDNSEISSFSSVFEDYPNSDLFRHSPKLVCPRDHRYIVIGQSIVCPKCLKIQDWLYSGISLALRSRTPVNLQPLQQTSGFCCFMQSLVKERAHNSTQDSCGCHYTRSMIFMTGKVTSYLRLQLKIMYNICL